MAFKFNPLTGRLDVVNETAITTNIDLQNTYKVINSLNPTNPQDVATKSYVDSVAGSGGGSSFVPVFLASGLTFTLPSTSQALFSYPITSEGDLDLSGILIEV